MVVVTIELSFYKIALLLESGICSVIQFIKIIDLTGKTGGTTLSV
jgi:hypothetical protein